MLPSPEEDDELLELDDELEEDDVLDPVPDTVCPSAPTRPTGPLLGTHNPDDSPAWMKMPLP